MFSFLKYFISDFRHEESLVFAHDWSTHYELLILPGQITSRFEIMNSVIGHVIRALIVNELLVPVLFRQVQLFNWYIHVAFVF